MTHYEQAAGPFRLRLNRTGPAGGTLHMHDADVAGLRIHKPDMHDLLSRLRVLELGYDRWGQPLQLGHGVIIFDKTRTSTRTFGRYRATSSTLADLIRLADALAAYFDHRRFKCKWCGESVEQDTGARAYHPKCRKQKANHDYHKRVRRPRLDALKASN